MADGGVRRATNVLVECDSRDSFEDYFRMLRCDFEEHFGRAGWLTTALLPILQCIEANAESSGELGLAQAQSRAYRSDGIGRNPIDACHSLAATPQVGTGFTDTLEHFVKGGFFHGNSCWTNFASCFVCAAVRSPWTFWA